VDLIEWQKQQNAQLCADGRRRGLRPLRGEVSQRPYAYSAVVTRSETVWEPPTGLGKARGKVIVVFCCIIRLVRQFKVDLRLLCQLANSNGFVRTVDENVLGDYNVFDDRTCKYAIKIKLKIFLINLYYTQMTS